MTTPTVTENSAAALIARFLKARGVDRVFALCGGHIMPIWMRLDAEGIRIVDVRDERAAVYMAHAHAELTGGLGVALVTAGPGVTNAMTGIANAHVARASVLVLSGTPPRAQENRGALQDMAHTDFVRPLTRYARTVREPRWCCRSSTRRSSRAFGQGGEPGPVYLDFPADTLRAEVPRALQLPEHFAPKPRAAMLPDPAAVQAAVDLLWSAKRPLFISGRGARGAGGAADAAARPPRRAVPGHRREPRPGARRTSFGRRRDARLGDEPGRPGDHRRPPARLPARLRLAGGVRRRPGSLRIADCAPSCATTGAARSRSWRRRRDALEAILAAAADRTPATDREWARECAPSTWSAPTSCCASMNGARPAATA